ncbi:MAG: alpha/beta hydrolase [Gammaproteobacteria bacterium]|nr:alpha/beta hydrolase [Gammaproteobacteria bacterium]MDH4310394.1 alpha/beta hydrolase [Gammaproteobacteria bacterium]MDH5273900.1 alpha/beta hydrolase [Gammaproteobacteria bacterium]
MTLRPEAPAVERRPVAPAWFGAALAQAPERTHLEVEGAEIEVLTWGERGQPGLLLLHGMTAHADWWTFLAPLLAQGRRVAAFSLSGMGRSDWRDAYSLEQYAREAIAVANAAGLFDSAVAPILIGHSFGSFATRIVARTLGARLAGIVLVDGALAAGDNDREYHDVPVRGHRHRVYPTLEQAVARFRFEPAQSCDHPYILDFLARTSLGLTPSPHGGDGWSWRFDPDLRAKIRITPSAELLAPVTCRMALLFGDRSKLMTSARLELIRRHTPPEAPWIVIPDAGHHVMVDQPLALIAALRSLLEAWQPAATLAQSFTLPTPSVPA